jgi:hypothetical protein
LPVPVEALPAEEDDPPGRGVLAALGAGPPDPPQPASAAQDRTKAAVAGTARRAALRAGMSCSRDLEVSVWGGPG